MKNKWSYLFVGAIACVIACLNWPKSGMIMGWDNLMTQFDIGMNIGRELSGVWQEYQGLGLLAGMGHAADLVRLGVEYLLSYLVPNNYIRAIEIFGSYIFGGLGVVWLLGKLIDDGWRGKKVAQVASGLFYLLSLGTVQNFWVPFEPYYWAYGLFPWLLGSFLEYLREGNRKRLLMYVLLSLLATPMGYLQTVYLVCFILLSLFGLGYILKRSSEDGLWKRVQRVGFALLLSLVVNSFWLMPQLYFFVTSVNVTTQAKMNAIATPEVALSNRAVGDIWSVMTMNGYWLQLHDYQKRGSFDYLMQPWVRHLAQRNVVMAQVGIVLLVLLGLACVLFSKIRWKYGLLLAVIFCLVILQGDSLPLGYLWVRVTNYLPILDQIFRSPFTKLIVYWDLIQAICFGLGLGWFFKLFNDKKVYVLQILAVLLVGLGIGLLTFVSWPIFTGNLFYSRLKIELPSEYKNSFISFNKLEHGRVVLMPIETLWGWRYHSWGHDGSGFLWYGIEQPILDRAFDVWSPYNEGFYNEFSNSLYQCQSDTVSQCREQNTMVLEKYDVRYVLLDESVISPGQGKEILRIEETNKLAEELRWEKEFQEGFLTVWEVPQSHSDTVTQYVSAPGSYTWMEADTSKVREDVVYGEVGHYVTAMTQPHGDTVSWGIYPFASLMREEAKNVEWGEGGLTISASVPSDTVTRELEVPGWEVGEIVRVDFTEDGVAIPAYTVNGQSGPVFLGKERPTDGKSYFFAKVSEGEEWREYREIRKYQLPSEKLEIEVKGEPFVYDFAKQGQGSIGNCDILKRGVATKDGGKYTADSHGAVCDYIVMEAPFTRVPYLLRLRGENVEGRSIKFFLWNTGSKRNDIEYLLGKGKFDQTFSLLPWDWDGHYTLNIETRSFGQRAENRIEPVVGMYVPLEKIARARIVAQCTPMYTNDQCTPIKLKNNLEVTYVKKTETWLYGLGVKGHGLIRLSQGYDEGWVAFVVPQSHSDKVTQLQHVKVDGWANGWIVGECAPISKCAPMSTNGEQGNQEAQIVIIFYWPQLLEYLGFALLAITLVYVIRSKDEDK